MGSSVFLAKFNHESNTFARDLTTLEDYRDEVELFGDEIPEYYRGTDTVVGGALDVATESDIEFRYSVAANTTPGGVVSREAYDYYTDYIVDDVRDAGDLDGVLLVLHGAMVQEGGDDGEGPLTRRVREMVGPDVPIVVTLDLHGNVTDELVDAADAIVAYETHPHLDMRETGHRAMDILNMAMAGDVDPVMAIERPPVLPHSPLQNTFKGPMAEVMDRARELEDRPGILKVSVLPGFHRADVPQMGFSIPVVADDDEALARETARDLAAMVWEMRQEFVGDYPAPSEAVARAKTLAADRDPDDGPVVMGDFGPQPGGGGSADGTPTLRAMIEQDLENAGYAIMCDPAVVDACIDAGPREHVTVTLGGKTDDMHGDPIEELTGYVKALTDGRFVNTGNSHSGSGTVTNLGRTVRFRCGESEGVNVIVTERRGNPFDAELWRHVGLQPEDMAVIAITSTTAFRGDYEPMASHIIEVDSPGVSSPIPSRFDYHRLERPKFPIDELADDAYPDWSTAD